MSNQPFLSYVEEKILEPLGMTHSTVRQDLPENFPGERVTAYLRSRGELRPAPTTYSRQVSAGGLITTAPDMARLMLTYLQGGELDGARVLELRTVEQMFSGQFRVDERLPGMSYGWFEATVNGQEVFFHSGDTSTVSSLLAVVPSAEMGLFVAYNRQTSSPRFNILYALMDACFPPADDAPPAPMEGAAERVHRFAGLYRGNRIAHSSIGKLNIINNLKRVTTTDDGLLDVDGKRYVETEPLLFVNVNNPDDVIAFRLDDEGGGPYLLVGERPNQAWERIPWYQNPSLHGIVLIVSLLLFLGSLIAWSISLLRRSGQSTPLIQTAQWMGLAMSAMAIAAVLTLAGWLMMGNPAELGFGTPPLVNLAIVLASLFGLLVAASLAVAALLWTRGAGSTLGRWHYTLTTLTAILFATVLSYWNFLPI